ncbi:hypothetical protein BH11PSE2_BH11PSE2_21970 [soil metagenome]
MLATLVEFESAVTRAVTALGEPPEPGSQEHEDFLHLLHEIEISRSHIEDKIAAGPLADERAALDRHLAEYDRRFRAQEKLARDHRSGEGVGQTHGMF